jgi:hypothetical protein
MSNFQLYHGMCSTCHTLDTPLIKNMMAYNCHWLVKIFIYLYIILHHRFRFANGKNIIYYSIHDMSNTLSRKGLSWRQNWVCSTTLRDLTYTHCNLWHHRQFITKFYQFLHIRIGIIHGSHMYILFLPRVGLHVSFLPLANAGDIKAYPW